MKEQRKKIITSEIEYWRRSNLLPGQYCDFLLNLYTEGEAAGKNPQQTREQTSTTFEALPAFSIPKIEMKWVAIALFMIILLYLAFHFTDFTLTMQMTLIGFLTILFYVLGFIKEKGSLSSHLFLAIASVLLALGGVYLLELYGYQANEIVLYLAAACVIWYLTGILSGKRYLSFCALLGLQGAYGWLIYYKLYAQFAWWQMEMLWIPIAILLITLGLIWKRRQQKTSAILFFSGILALFGPEIESLIIPAADKDLLLYFLYLKIFVASFLLLSLKNFWWSWISTQQPLR
jgi:hypothetical protein